MRLAALSLLLLVPAPVAADPLCAGVTVTAGGASYGAPFCVDPLPVTTVCQREVLAVVGTSVTLTVVVCAPG